jgi:hypothetical protein
VIAAASSIDERADSSILPLAGRIITKEVSTYGKEEKGREEDEEEGHEEEGHQAQEGVTPRAE